MPLGIRIEVRIQFLGATRTTMGSMFPQAFNGQRILLECGLLRGKWDESIERNRHFLFDLRTIDAVVLSHVRIDHRGNLPNLCRQGYRGNIYCTFATRDPAVIMLEDSAEIQRADAESISKRRAKKDCRPSGRCIRRPTQKEPSACSCRFITPAIPRDRRSSVNK